MSFNYPSQHDEAKFGVIKCGIRSIHDFPVHEQRAAIGMGVSGLLVLGPTFIWWNHLNECDIIFTHWDDMDDGPRAPGRTTIAKKLCELDPVMIHGFEEWKRTAAHEAMSIFGCLHIRHNSTEVGPLDNSGDPFAPGGHGDAVMNQLISYNKEQSLEQDFVTTGTNRLPIVHPTQLDINEFNRVWPAWKAKHRPNGIILA